MFLHRVASTPDADAFYHPTSNGQWATLKWQDVGERVRNIAGGLRSLGLDNEERCAILSNTRVEWILVDIGILCSGGATSTIYPSSSAEECAYIIGDSDTRVVFCEDQVQLDKILEIREQLPSLHHAVLLEGPGGSDDFVLTLDELEAAGLAWHAANESAYEDIARGVEPDSLATLIYTSGTTGKPKGVRLTHDAWVFEGEAMDNLGFLSPADKQFLWLPLAHSFGKVLEASIIRIGIPTAIDGRIDRIVENMATIQPTFMGAVPRIFEKVYNKVVTGAKAGGPLKWRIFNWALRQGRAASQLRQQGKEPRGLLALKFAMANKLVFSKLQATFGGRVRFFISGGAPLARELAEFFHAAGILILEGYGLTESAAASFVNAPGKFKFGTVGHPLPGVDLRIDPEDGEILIKSRGVMAGYHNRAEATAEALTEDGWLRTGDIGALDPDGYLKITDRKKDLIKTSGGKYVAPQELEGRLKIISPLIGQVLVHGNNRNFCSALITLNVDHIPKWADGHGKGSHSYVQLSKDAEVTAAVQEAVDTLNNGLAKHETIKRFALLPSDFTIESGELTPSMKVKRRVVETKYRDVLDGFYTGSVAQI